jgi:magnesium transporter
MEIDELAMEDLNEGRQRTKLETYSDHWHVALYDCHLDGTELIAHELDVLFGAGWLLTLHHHDDDSLLNEMRRRYERQRFEHDTTDEGFALWAALDVIVDRWFTVSDQIDDELEVIEDVVFASESQHIPIGVFALRRSLVTFPRTVSPTREVLTALLRRDAAVIGDRALAHLHDVNDHVIRVIELIESQRELLTGLLEAQLAIASNRMNQVMKATSSWGAILVMNTLIAGIYGMNFRHMPELHWMVGYPLALALMALVTVGGYRLFKHRDWL